MQMKISEHLNEKVTANLSGFLIAGWLDFIEQVGKEVVFGPHFKKEQFIRHMRTIITRAKEVECEIINDMGNDGLIFYGNPWEI